MAINIPRQAARLAYYAQFHAAQAFIFEQTDKIAKTHRGVKSQFHKLAKEDPRIDSGLAGDLAATYHFKEAADYEAGQESTISPEDASDAIRAAERFVGSINGVLSGVQATGKG